VVGFRSAVIAAQGEIFRGSYASIGKLVSLRPSWPVHYDHDVEIAVMGGELVFLKFVLQILPNEPGGAGWKLAVPEPLACNSVDLISDVDVGRAFRQWRQLVYQTVKVRFWNVAHRAFEGVLLHACVFLFGCKTAPGCFLVCDVFYDSAGLARQINKILSGHLPGLNATICRVPLALVVNFRRMGDRRLCRAVEWMAAWAVRPAPASVLDDV